MSKLHVKSPGEYSDNHADGRQFSGKQGKSMTAHVWLNTYSENNIVKLGENESYIDEGNGNQIKNRIKYSNALGERGSPFVVVSSLHV